MPMIACLFSCEHATCAVPEAHRELFRGKEELVSSPEGWDPGALNLAQGFSMKFRTPLVHGDLTRLLIDLNENGEKRWSHISKELPETTLTKLVERHERSYRTTLANRISEGLLRNSAVIHLMIHTESRDEAAVLIEAGGSGVGSSIADAWKTRLQNEGVKTTLVVNGLEGGLVEDLLAAHDPERYGLLRIKVPLSYFLEGKPLRWETLKKMLISSLEQVVAAYEIPEKAVEL